MTFRRIEGCIPVLQERVLQRSWKGRMDAVGDEI